MKPAYFITGTDTEIGKTLTTCALIHALGQQGLHVAGMKPIAAGTEEVDGRWCNEDVARIRAVATAEVEIDDVCPYLFREPAAPHIAAALENLRIERDVIRAAFTRLQVASDAVIVEGVGGFRVPLAADFDSADLAQELNLPVILVVGMRLGCINHALLSAEAIAARGLSLAGWVANTVDVNMGHRDANIEALQASLPAPYLGLIPRYAGHQPGQAATCLNFSALPAWPHVARGEV